MFEPSQLITFTIAAYLLIIVPGPAVMFVIARSVEHGRKAGLASVLGVALGSLVHTLFAALGLSAILATSALAFNVVKYAGAVYLIYLGIKTLRERTPANVTVEIEEKPLGQIVREGIIVNVLNPKAALFFLAFLPQFADPARGSVALQIIVLGLIFFVVALMSDGMYALLAGSFGRLLKQNPSWQRRQKVVSGTTYIALGVVAAVSGSGDSS